jgi:hypothetical protein
MAFTFSRETIRPRLSYVPFPLLPFQILKEPVEAVAMHRDATSRGTLIGHALEKFVHTDQPASGLATHGTAGHSNRSFSAAAR